jgi:hypothetical protein
MPLVKSLAEVLVSTTIGHMIRVPPDTPTYVPPEVLPFALRQGCVECTETGEVILQKPKAPKAKPAVPEAVPQLSQEEQQDPQRRSYVLKLAIAKLYADNNADDFTLADHRPKVKAVESVVGFAVTGTELAAALELYQASV